jgi:hypothetical protein
MKKMGYFIPAPCLILLLFFACKKPAVTVDCSTILQPTINYPHIVDAGDSLKMYTTTDGNPVSYTWSGPNGFYSSDKNPVVPKIQSNGAGKYVVTVNYGNGCTKSATTDTISVLVPATPCVTSNNTANLSDTATAYFNSITSSYSGSVYTITANGSGKIVMQFLNTSHPVPGVYTIQPQGGITAFGYVRVRYNDLQAADGKVYVSIANNKISAGFCEVLVSNLTGDQKITMTGTVTEQ